MTEKEKRRNDEVAAIFGDNLAHWRDDAEISQEELGIRAKLHRTEISQLERGLRVPRIDTLVKLAASLDIEPEALLDGMDYQPARVVPGRFA